MTRPITRGEIFNTKLTVVLLYILLLNLAASLTGIICIELVKKGSYDISAFIILSTYTLLLNLLFGAMGVFLSTLIRKPKPITTFAIALVLVFYFIFTLSKITESAARIGYLSPFKYVNTNVGDPAYSLDYRVVLYFTGLSVMLLLISFRLYKRKDIYV
jgi:ABC-2 type transport system permease protein